MPRSPRVRRTSTGPPSGEYLTAFSTRFTSTWRSCCSSAATCGSRFGASSERVIPSGRCARAASRTLSVSRAASTVSIRNCSWPESRWLASSTSLTICASRSDSSATTSSSLPRISVAELEVLAPQRDRGAVDRRERRAQLVRDGRDEVGAHLLERALLGQVAEGVDGPFLEAHAPRTRATARGRRSRAARVCGRPSTSTGATFSA